MSPTIAVLLATVHRPDDLALALESALRLEHARFEIRIVDQSDDARTAEVVQPFLEEPRVHYQRLAGRGLSAALNAAASATEADLLAITGDDCVMREDWLSEIERAFDRDPEIGVVFGSTAPGEYESDDGFIPGCVIEQDATVNSLADMHRMSGTTANMAVRTSVWRQLHGFDESLGVGAPLRSAEDLDFALRALRAGHKILQTPGPSVVHLSPTLWRDRAATIHRNWYGSGAALAKCLKLSPIEMFVLLGRLGGRWVRGGSGVAATYGPKPARASMLRGFASGFLVGLFRGVDREHQHFVR